MSDTYMHNTSVSFLSDLNQFLLNIMSETLSSVYSFLQTAVADLNSYTAIN